jgi:hypothetical protein
MSEPAPEDAPFLVVHPEIVGRRAGFTLPLTEDDRFAIEQAILDAQGTVQGYLRRPIQPTEVTVTGLYPDPWGYGRWDLPDPDARDIVAEPELSSGLATGLYTVTYTTGLDVATDPALEPIRRFIVAAALNAPEVLRRWQLVTAGSRTVKSVSVDGQAITYGDATQGGGGAAGSGAPGALPKLGSLSQWRRRSVYQRRGYFVTLGSRPWWW